MSPTSQNELISIVEICIIQIWRIEEIKELKCTSISAVYVYIFIYTESVYMYIYIYIYIYI